MIGTTLGKYRVTDRLGRGGMGVVYKAVDETLEREVAVKMLSSELAETDAVKRFKVEATTLARLNHPGIATIYELYRTDADVAMVMEFVRGETFDRLIERCGPLPPERAAYLCAQVLEALGHAHRAGIVHRDVKPSNLMLTEYGTVKIMDFGIARVLGSEHLTNDGYMMGTPAYMAPEQVLGQDIDGRADLYSVGVVLYRLITGHLPFTADTAIAMVQRQIKDPPTPVRQFRADVPDWCEQTLDRILAKSPADRFQTAEEFRAALLRGAGAAAAMNALVSVPDEIERTTPPDAMRVPTFTPALPVSAPTVGVATPPVAPPSSGSAAHVVPTEQPRSEKRRSAHTRGLAIAATAVVVVGAVAVTLLIGRPDTPENPSQVASAPSTATTSGGSAATPAAENVPPPEASSPAIEQVAAPAVSGSTAPATARRRRAVPEAPDKPPPIVEEAPAPPPGPAAEPPPSAAAALPPVAFKELKIVVTEQGNARQRDATLQLAGGRITVADPSGAVFKALPYDAVLSITYAKSRHPLWQGPAGPIVAARAADGPFGVFRGDRHWLTIRTRAFFVILRLRKENVESVTAALQQRTGAPVIRVEGRDRDN